MISGISSAAEFEGAYLSPDYYGRKIRANYLAYGLGYDFCRFFAVTSENGKGTLSVCNGSGAFTGAGVIDFDELLEFLEICGCESFEYPPEYGEKGNAFWKPLNRTLFEFSAHKKASGRLDEAPRLDDVYKIVSEGFPELSGCYAEWLADVSHRVRHNVSRVFLFEENAAAMRYWSIDGFSFYGQIAVSENARGKALGRRMLYLLAEKENELGNKAQLFAKDHRKSFYKEIGFLPVGEDWILERIKKED